MPVITLTTDFGLDDWFVGALKGVILRRLPTASIVDITHAVPAGNIRAGAFALRNAWSSFPSETVHVAVVDPGVGSDRPAITVEAGEQFFVGPDNGLLSWALNDTPDRVIHRLENRKLFASEVSRTFHGRDIFAPVATALAAGVSIAEVGPQIDHFQELPWPKPEQSAHSVNGQVIYVDRFGNTITNIPNSQIKVGDVIDFGGQLPSHVGDCYASVPPGETVGVQGSSGLLEIAVNGGNAAAIHGLGIARTVTVHG
ncbi:MAG: S-adenosylmethionine hydrolase [Limisphaerales bacterium]|jgi:S-adenosylmethionine hydrolase